MIAAPALVYFQGTDPEPKYALNKQQVVAYRDTKIEPASNRALSAGAAFRGDVLIVESEHDSIVPHPVIESYLAAFKQAQSMTYRVIKGADHSLSQKEWGRSYTSILVKWVSEMVLGAKEDALKAKSGGKLPAKPVLEEAADLDEVMMRR